MRFEEHCRESEFMFGQAYEEVHRWLDEFAGKPGIGMKHRVFRHHLEGVEEVRRLWGDGAARAALRHILSDLAMEGWTEQDPIPKNSSDYQKMGFY